MNALKNPELVELLRETLRQEDTKTGKTRARKIVEKLVQQAERGSYKAIALILDRIEGKVPETTVALDRDGIIEEMSEEELVKIVRQGREARRRQRASKKEAGAKKSS